ncbi:MAG: DUF3786 domain-containing protein [Candidatus Omnitrophota bacterium]
MSYNLSLSKAWAELDVIAKQKSFPVRFLSQEYKIDLDKRDVFTSPSLASLHHQHSILILHYIIRKLKGLAPIAGEWVSFKEMDGGMPYYPAFKKRTIDVILKEYGTKPEFLLEVSRRFKSEKVELADASIVLEVFEGVPVLITLWRGDEEFSPEVNMLFDKSIKEIFCSEDIAVLSGIVAVTLVKAGVETRVN